MKSQDTSKSSSEESSSKTLAESLQDIKRDLFSYVEKRVELLVIQLTEPFAAIISRLFQQVIGFLIALVGFIFVWGAIALLLSQLLDSTVIGFLVAGAPLFLIGSFLFFRKPGVLQRFMHANMVDQIMDNLKFTDSDSQKGDEQ
jgi:uncharacterized membrane protein YqjE